MTVSIVDNIVVWSALRLILILMKELLTEITIVADKPHIDVVIIIIILITFIIFI